MNKIEDKSRLLINMATKEYVKTKDLTFCNLLVLVESWKWNTFLPFIFLIDRSSFVKGNVWAISYGIVVLQKMIVEPHGGRQTVEPEILRSKFGQSCYVQGTGNLWTMLCRMGDVVPSINLQKK